MTERANTVSESGPARALNFGPFQVSTGRKEIETFSQETGWPQIVSNGRTPGRDIPDLVPHTFPMSWLGLPEMHAAIETELKTACGIAIHESQSFLYEQRLAVDKDYLMTAEIEHQDNPKRLVLRIRVEKQTHESVLRMETILRIVSAAESAP